MYDSKPTYITYLKKTKHWGAVGWGPMFLLWQIFTISWLFFKKNRQIFKQSNKSTHCFEQVDRISRILLNFYFHSRSIAKHGWISFWTIATKLEKKKTGGVGWGRVTLEGSLISVCIYSPGYIWNCDRAKGRAARGGGRWGKGPHVKTLRNRLPTRPASRARAPQVAVRGSEKCASGLDSRYGCCRCALLSTP